MATTDNAIELGMSAAFSGPSRGLGNELYRGIVACLDRVNAEGGVDGRPVELRAMDDAYQPDQCVANTTKLMLEHDVFALFGYVGTPTVSRVLPLLQALQDRHTYLFFPFTGAQPHREPPFGEFAFNLRPSYRAETAGTGGQPAGHWPASALPFSTRTTTTGAAARRGSARRCGGAANSWPGRRPTFAAIRSC